MKAGFGKVDITPRLGVEMAGFGPFLHRTAKEFRDFLYARAMAVDDGRDRWVLVSCDLIGVDPETVSEARRLIAAQTGLSDRQIMIHCTHTHSGPATCLLFGWGEPDGPYMTRLPHRIAAAAIAAVRDLREARFSCATAPAKHIAWNRETDSRPTYEDALSDDWQPAHPDHADRTAFVLRVERGGQVAGFLSSFSCHPVVCCEQTHSLHGDFVGVATNLVEAEHPGAVGLFLQGAHGDTNTAVCHESQERSLRALTVFANRYARAIREGLHRARPMKSTPVAATLERVAFRRADWPIGQIEDEMAKLREHIVNPEDGETSRDGRISTVFLLGMREALARLRRTGTHNTTEDMQALRLGTLTILGTPFELFRGIRDRVDREAGEAPLLMLSVTNGCAGYAVTRERFARADYAATRVPFILGHPPYTADLEDEIVAASLRVLRTLRAK